ncbi:acetyl-coenzyme A transporter 1-domain-containing protein [Chytriomyces cf. hyalinus JEL632]|nr:acetyl-coenzyme A transporter 1-domain-containing protein [Chytriomyces cf. hyalinus JEL632]
MGKATPRRRTPTNGSSAPSNVSGQPQMNTVSSGAAATGSEKRGHALTKPAAGSKGIQSELPDFILLIILYLLQGVPLGLIMGSVPFLLKSKLSFGDIALFSLSSYPYSLKLLWSPIVDSIYNKPIGRRKSWIVPIQAVTGVFLIFLSRSIDIYVSPESSEPVPVTFLALTFASLVFLCATQDIAVDGWALTLLSEENKAYASTAQTIGLNSGYFLSFTVFLALNSREFCEKYLGVQEGPLVLLGQYLAFWGVMFLVCDLWLIFVKKEDPELEEPAENEIQIVYKHIFQVISLPNMRQLIFMTMVSKIGFMAHDSVSALKLLEKGFSKEDLALTVLIDFPIQIFVGYYVAKWSTGPRPLRPWLNAYYVRLGFSILGMLIVSSVPKTIGTSYFLFVILFSVLNSMVSTVMFVGVGSYYTKISDPRIGGTYMTLLNTINNLAGTWPKYFVLKSVDYFTDAHCSGGRVAEHGFSCTSEVSKKECSKLGGVCALGQDGYYPVSLVCVVVGVVVLFTVVRPTVLALEKVPDAAWRVARDGDDGDESTQLIAGSKRD